MRESIRLGDELVVRYEWRLGDWLLRLWRTVAPWGYRKRLACWPYRTYSLYLGWCEIDLKYAPACVLCLDDEHVIYPGKLCPWCHAMREKRPAFPVLGFLAPDDGRTP